MSMVLNGSTQWAHRAVSGSPTAYCVAAWIRRDADLGRTEQVLRFASGGFGTGTRIESTDSLVPVHSFSVGGAAVTFTTTTWRWVMLRYSGGTQRLRTLNDGDTAWASVSEQTGLSDETLTDLLIGNGSTGAADDQMQATVAAYKLWIGTLPTEAEVLTERLSTAVTVTAGLWASYVFATGALDADSSGNSRPLTLVGTPTFTSDKPTDLTIAGGGPTATPALGRWRTIR